MGFLAGCPIFDYLLRALLILLDDLDLGAFDFLAVCNIRLADLYLGLGILDQQYAILRDCSSGCHLASLINRECRVACDRIAFRRYCLFQHIFHTGLQTFDYMGFLAGYPLFDYFALFKDLDLCSFYFLAISDVSLADLDLSLGIFNQKYSVLGNCSRGCHFSGLINGEFRVSCNSVSVGSHCLTQNVLNACLQAFHHMRFLCGIPFGDHFLTQHALLNDLNVSALKFLTISDISLAYTYLCLSILNQNNTITGYCSFCLKLALVVDHESCLCGYCVTFRSYFLAQCVFNICLQAFDHMGFLAGCPGVYDLLIAIFVLFDDLDCCAFKFLAACYINFAYADLRL